MVSGGHPDFCEALRFGLLTRTQPSFVAGTSKREQTMSLDLESDPLLSFAEAGRHIRPGRPPHVSTFHRWTKGVRGCRLETILVGGRRYVRLSQLNSFIAALSGPVPLPTAQVQRKSTRGFDAAECELDQAGIQ